MKKIDLVILAGGKGSRIKNFLVGKPKPMLKFNNKYRPVVRNKVHHYNITGVIIRI